MTINGEIKCNSCNRQYKCNVKFIGNTHTHITFNNKYPALINRMEFGNYQLSIVTHCPGCNQKLKNVIDMEDIEDVNYIIIDQHYDDIDE